MDSAATSSCSTKPQPIMPSEFAHAMRSAELALAMQLLPAGGSILELGAGDGWQASILGENGFDVTAVDIACTKTGAKRYVPVVTYDGQTLPFPDRSFDAVFSSNVLEHVKDFVRVQTELARVLKPGGVAVHCVPTAVWRFWTTVGHPLHALRLALGSHRKTGAIQNKTRANPVAARAAENGVLGLLRLGLIAPRHGEHGTVFSEHYLFSRRSWQHRFDQAGWRIIATQPTGLFYSGNELCGLYLTPYLRRQMAKLFGSSTIIFVTLPQPPIPTTHL